MAGVDVAGLGGGRRRSLDSEINMIPMIDLLMVTISLHAARRDVRIGTKIEHLPAFNVAFATD